MENTFHFSLVFPQSHQISKNTLQKLKNPLKCPSFWLKNGVFLPNFASIALKELVNYHILYFTSSKRHLSIELLGLHLYYAMTNIRALLAQNIKKRRKTLGFSQAVFAEKAGTSTHYIAQIEQKKKFPSSEMLERLASALEFDSPELFATKTFKDEAITKVQEKITADLAAVTETICERLSVLKKHTT